MFVWRENHEAQGRGVLLVQRGGCEVTVVYVERRPDSGELNAFVIGFVGSTPVQLMDGKWSKPLKWIRKKK